jgi:hypothetical protein
LVPLSRRLSDEPSLDKKARRAFLTKEGVGLRRSLSSSSISNYLCSFWLSLVVDRNFCFSIALMSSTGMDIVERNSRAMAKISSAFMSERV